jgi:O-antigen/teichoic acid export membrane protein
MGVVALLGFAISMNIAVEMLIYAQGRPESGWRPMGFAAAANAVIAMPLILLLGVRGAILGNATTSLMAAVLVLRAFSNDRVAATHGRGQ